MSPHVDLFRALTAAPDIENPPRALPWADQALCAQADPDLWFEQSSSRYETKSVTSVEAEERRSMAKAICERCPVTAECLSWALAHDERYGIWGGTDPSERARMRRRRTA